MKISQINSINFKAVYNMAGHYNVLARQVKDAIEYAHLDDKYECEYDRDIVILSQAGGSVIIRTLPLTKETKKRRLQEIYDEGRIITPEIREKYKY